MMPVLVRVKKPSSIDCRCANSRTRSAAITLLPTVAVSAVLAAYNWPADHPRRHKLNRFIQRFSENFSVLLNPPFHPKWKDINLAATVPGWNRFSIAEEALQKATKAVGQGDEVLKRDFQTFLASTRRTPRNQTEHESLFREFMTWREKQAGR